MLRIAIIGRPNVGKSTLFNRLSRGRRALVSREPGMTRDRLSAVATWYEKSFEVVDTGGLVPGDSDGMAGQVLRQAEMAIQDSDLILLVVDVRDGPTVVDERLNQLMRASGKEYLLVVNKVDVPRLEPEALEFYRFGVESLHLMSAEHKAGLDALVEAILGRLAEAPASSEVEEVRVAIIGRPNVGKSSLLNRLVGNNRAIVTETPGTTRDAVDSLLSFQDRTIRLIDTAGIRRKGRTQGLAEKLSVVMARKSIERADVAFLVLDAAEKATHLDAVIGGYADKAGTSVIVLVNKWDLVPKDTLTAQSLEKTFRQRMRFLDYAPLLFVSALTGQRVSRALEEAICAYDARRKRISTGELNRFLESVLRPHMFRGAPQRKYPLKYAAQVSTGPPTFVLFTRAGGRLHFSTLRFLSNRLRSRFDFYATPIRFVQRSKN